MSQMATSDEQQQAYLPETAPESLLTTNRRLLVELQALSSRINAVNEIATAINRSLNLDEILALVGRQAKWLFDFDHCSIYLQDEEMDRFVVLFGQETAVESFNADSGYCVDAAMRTAQSQLVKEASRAEASLHSYVVIPLQSESIVLGTLNFASQQKEHYTQEDLRIAYLLALQLSGAIRNARRFAEMRRLYTELEQTYANLQRAESWREDLTNMVVHDLRGQLNTIMAGSEMVAVLMHEERDRRLQQKTITYIQQASTDMSHMIDSILSISQLEAGDLHPALQPTDLVALLAEKTTVYQSDAEKHGVLLRFSNPDTLPLVSIDTQLVGRLLDNLVSNAFKYTDAGGQVEIRTTVLSSAQLVQVEITDNGIGIPIAYQSQIFEKFAQVRDAEGRPLRQGTGLGLAFCRLVAQAHGGQIWVMSEEGKGSSFYFTLPVVSP